MFGNLKKIILISIAVFTVFSLSQTVSAQSIDQASVTMDSSPINPKPGDTVTLTLSSDSINLDSAKITWYVDEKAANEGVGQNTITIQAKNNSDAIVVRALIQTSDGAVSEVSKEIVPAGVDLIIEPTSYLPPFYKGKGIFVNQGTIRLIAIPNIISGGKQISKNNLVFKWQQNGTVIQSGSGAGKNSITINTGIPIRDVDIDLQILDTSGNTIAAVSKTLSPNQPQIFFYENSPLYGILFNKAITDSYYLGQKEEINVAAEPFSFNITSANSSGLNYQWSVNGNPVSTSGKVNELLLRQGNTNLKGTAAISLTLNSVNKIFQYTTAGFNVSFGQ